MRKKNDSARQNGLFLSRATLALYIPGMLMIAVPLFCVIAKLSAHTTLSIPQVKYYANILEHIIAAFTLLTCGCYLVERMAREKNKTE